MSGLGGIGMRGGRIGMDVELCCSFSVGGEAMHAWRLYTFDVVGSVGVICSSVPIVVCV